MDFRDALKSNKPVGGKAMTDKKNRERVIAEITLSHLMRLRNEQGCPVTREQALAFLNQEGRAFEMWKHMMQAAEEFIAGACSRIPSPPKHTTDSCLGLGQSDQSAMPRCSVFSRSLRPHPRIVQTMGKCKNGPSQRYV